MISRWLRGPLITTATLTCCALSAPSAGAETLHDAIAAAWAHDPAAQASLIDAQSAHRTAEDTDSWFPGGPVLNGQYLDDHFIGSNVGYTTYFGTVMIPLWLPGQGTATVRRALADEALARSAVKVEKLIMAVQVLDNTSTAIVLERELANLRETVHILDRVVTLSASAVKTGESPAIDHEAAVGAREDLAARIADDEQRLATAEAELESLTGDAAIPDLLALDGHLLSTAGSTLDPQKDPRMLMAAAAIKHAEASYTLAAHSYMPAPQVGLAVTKQGQYGSPWDTQVGGQFSVTLPSSARNTPMMMQETRALAAARRDATLTQRKITVEYRQTRARLAATIKVLDHTRKTETALDRRADQLEKAWRIGEMPIIEYLRARMAALDAKQRAAQADVLWHAAVVRILLMNGQTP